MKDIRGKWPLSYYLEEEDSERTKELIDRCDCSDVIRMKKKGFRIISICFICRTSFFMETQ